MCNLNVLNFATIILTIIGLLLDMYGVYKLFKLSPPALDESPTGRFEASLDDWSDLQKAHQIAIDLNDNILELRFETERINRESKKYFKLIIIGFLFQLVSVIVSIFS